MDDIAITRIMPNSLEAEQSVIGSMLMDKQAIISAGEILSADDFYHRQYGIMFQAQAYEAAYNSVISVISGQDYSGITQI